MNRLSYSFELPTHRVENISEFITEGAVAELAAAAEQAGFGGVHVTDHPAPDAKWLDFGGHHALDPFVALSFAAASTSTVKLITNILVMAYRNPFLTAKAVQSLDLLSEGRLIVGTAAGYLKPEFAALGVDFDRRAEIMDQNLDVLSRVLAGEDVGVEGIGFAARAVRMRPLPAGGGRPPIWIGGNSRAAIRRAVKYDGWAPFATAGYAAASRTATIDDISDLERSIAYLREMAEISGRKDPMEVCFSAGTLLDPGLPLEERRETVDRLAAAGVTWLTITLPATSRKELMAGMEQFGEEFMERPRH